MLRTAGTRDPIDRTQLPRKPMTEPTASQGPSESPVLAAARRTGDVDGGARPGQFDSHAACRPQAGRRRRAGPAHSRTGRADVERPARRPGRARAGRHRPGSKSDKRVSLREHVGPVAPDRRPESSPEAPSVWAPRRAAVTPRAAGCVPIRLIPTPAATSRGGMKSIQSRATSPMLRPDQIDQHAAAAGSTRPRPEPVAER